LVFVKVVSQEHLYGEVYRSRVKDWIYNVRTEAPEKDTKTALEAEPLYEAERLRIIYQLITNPKEEGGAGITPKSGEWVNVESVFALHDHQFNKEWIKTLSKAYSLNAGHLDEIRNRFGEKIAYYFAFIQAYFRYLIYIAVIGASSWYLLGHFSPIYGVINALGCIIFTEFWKHQEVDLAIRWGVRGVSSIEAKKQDFKHEKEINDPITGEKVRVFSPVKRLQRQLLQIPFAICVATLLGCVIATCFGIEVFISEVYDGPLKSVLVRHYGSSLILTELISICRSSCQQVFSRLRCPSSQWFYKT
jgi:anoctamin-10